jgi:hypothetical protein
VSGVRVPPALLSLTCLVARFRLVPAEPFPPLWKARTAGPVRGTTGGSPDVDHAQHESDLVAVSAPTLENKRSRLQLRSILEGHEGMLVHRAVVDLFTTHRTTPFVIHVHLVPIGSALMIR